MHECNLTGKDPVIMTDNATNMVYAVEMMELPHVVCFVYILKLVSQAMLKLSVEIE